MMRVDDDDVMPHRRKRPGRKPWRVDVYRDRFLVWGAGWRRSGSYANERDAIEGYRSHVKRMEGLGRLWTAVRLVSPEGVVVHFEGTAKQWAQTVDPGEQP